MRVGTRFLSGTSALGLCAALAVSCNTSGIKRVFMAPDEAGTIDRLTFVAGSPMYCIADVAIGDPQAVVQVSFQPVSLNGQRTGLPPLLMSEKITGKFTGKLATEFPKQTVQAIPDLREPGKFTTNSAAQTPGLYRCIVRVDDELDYVDFGVAPGQAPTTEAAAPAPGACSAETVGNCPLSNGGEGIVRCCTLTGACGTGPLGTGFCYPSN